MKSLWLSLWIATLALPALAQTATNTAPEAEDDLPPLNWVKGPGTGKLGDVAQIAVPEKFVFCDGNDTRKLLEAMHNPPTDAEVGLLAPKGFDWFVVFEYSAVGYVKDDEKANLDADKMLESMKKGNEEGNKERKRRGWSELTLTGWQQPPQYDPETQNLTWATIAESNGRQSINYNTRLLGRHGVMSVTLVLGPDDLSTAVPEFKKLLKEFTYVSGERYAEYRQGDKIAKYGLTALVVGGGAALAAKAGLFKHLWKFILIGVAAVSGFIKKLFGKKTE